MGFVQCERPYGLKAFRLRILQNVVYNRNMKRFIFMLLFFAGVGFAGYVVLFMPAFFNANPGTGGINQGSGAFTGWDLMNNFVRSIFAWDHSFSFNPEQVFMVYAVALFLLVSAILVIVVLLQWLITGFRLGKLRKFYTVSLWFFIFSLVLSAAYAWFAIDAVNSAGAAGEFSINLFPFWALVPVGVGFVLSILGGVFRSSEGRRRR